MTSKTHISAIPLELADLPQWLIWRSENRDGKPTKVPHTTMGYRASVTNPDHWSTFENAMKAAARPGFAAGIGFVFSANDPYTGVDLDNVWKSDADEGARWAWQIIERFADSYAEESPSGKGLKLWIRAKPARCGRWAIGAGAIEIYDRARFFTVTGRGNGIGVVADHQADVDLLVTHLNAGAAKTTSGPIDNIIPYGTQHHVLVSLAGAMWKRGMTVEAIEAALQVTNTQQCERPGPPENIRRIAQSAGRWRR